MAQHTRNYTIQNDLFPAVRSDINAVLAAIVSNNSGPIAPSSPAAFQYWVNTSINPPVLNIRNSNNTTWIAIGPVDSNNLGLATALNATLTGTPTAPTAAGGTSTTQIATTAFVESPPAAIWLSLTLLNGFVAATASETPQYMRSRGIVYIRGRVQRAGFSSSTLTIATLPAGYRPANAVFIPMIHTASNGFASISSAGNIDFTAQTAPVGDIYPTFNLCFPL